MPRIGWSGTPCQVALAVCGVEMADRVRAVGQPERERGHVELAAIAVHAEAQIEDALDGNAALVEQRPGDAPDEIGVEPLVARRDRRVDGEHAVALDGRERVVERRPGRDVLAGPLGEEERRVALVEVPDRRRQPERPDRPDAADAEHELLVQAHLAAADVQDVGDRPVRVVVLGQVRVEQQDRDAPDLGQPDRDGEVATGQLDGDGQRQPGGVLHAPERQAGQVVVGVVVLLVAVGVDGLAEVALAVQQPDADAPGAPCRWPSSCGRRRARRGRPSRSRAIRGSRTRRRSRRSGRSAGRRTGAGTSGPSRWPCTASNSASTSWYSARNLASSSRRDHSVGPLMTGIGLR